MSNITPHRTARRAGWTTVVLALLAVAAIGAPTMALTPTPFATNIVRNGGAEAGSVGTTIPYWEPFLDFRVVAYGTSGFPSKSESSTFNGGSKFFWAGQVDPGYEQCGDALQNVFVRGRGAAIDAGNVRVIIRARLAVKGSEPDRARVRLSFRDADNHQLSGNPAPLVLSATGTGGDFKARSASRILPRGTRQMNVRLDATDADGSLSCDAYFDKISVKIYSV